jgi:hypothetical protein
LTCCISNDYDSAKDVMATTGIWDEYNDKKRITFRSARAARKRRDIDRRARARLQRNGLAAPLLPSEFAALARPTPKSGTTDSAIVGVSASSPTAATTAGVAAAGDKSAYGSVSTSIAPWLRPHEPYVRTMLLVMPRVGDIERVLTGTKHNGFPVVIMLSSHSIYSSFMLICWYDLINN